MPTTIPDIACTLCGCVCDDLRVTVDAGRVVRAEGACHLAEPWFLGLAEGACPGASIAGRPVPLAKALDRAAEVLAAARAPLFYGLSRSTEGQRAAVALAERLPHGRGAGAAAALPGVGLPQRPPGADRHRRAPRALMPPRSGV